MDRGRCEYVKVFDQRKCPKNPGVIPSYRFIKIREASRNVKIIGEEATIEKKKSVFMPERSMTGVIFALK